MSILTVVRDKKYRQKFCQQECWVFLLLFSSATILATDFVLKHIIIYLSVNSYLNFTIIPLDALVWLVIELYGSLIEIIAITVLENFAKLLLNHKIQKLAETSKSIDFCYVGKNIALYISLN